MGFLIGVLLVLTIGLLIYNVNDDSDSSETPTSGTEAPAATEAPAGGDESGG